MSILFDLPTSRTDAKSEGGKFFYTGQECRHGHVAARRTDTGGCTACDHAVLAAERTKKWATAKKTTDPLAYYVSRKGISCRNAKVPFDLDVEYVRSILPADGLCPILRTELLMPGCGDLSRRISLDQIRPMAGYTKGNVAVMSHRANRLKNDVTDPEVFRRLANWLEQNLSENPIDLPG